LAYIWVNESNLLIGQQNELGYTVAIFSRTDYECWLWIILKNSNV